MTNLDYTSIVFAAGLIVGVTLDLLLLRTLLAPPFRIWPTPEPGSWQSLTFWGLFRGGMVLTFVVAVLDWNATPLLDWTRFIVGLPLGLGGLLITVYGYFNLGLGNTYCGSDGLVRHGLYRFSRNPQYTASIVGLIGLSIGANSILTIVLSCVIIGAYVLMSLVEEDWLKQLYGTTYREYCERTARFLDVQGLIMAIGDRKKPSRQTG
jgi:protein-S-isoprenylcysteine O-methyltransferase Ste14